VLAAPKQIGRFNAQRISNSPEYLNAGISPSALDAARIGQVDLRFMGELLLCEARLVASAPYVRSYDGPPVDHLSKERCRAYIL